MKNQKLSPAKIIALTVIILVLILYFSRLFLEPKVIKKSRVLMGTIVNIIIFDRDLKKGEVASELAFQEMKRVERMLSIKDEYSELSRLNQNEDLKFHRVNPEIIFLLKESRRISRLSKGKFSICVGPLVNLWEEKLGEGQIPTEKEIKKILPLVDYRNIEINERNNMVRFRKKGVKINLAAIAKGYAVDQAAKTLRKSGIKNYLVEAGGDLFASGKGSNGKDWLIGVKNPRAANILFEFRCTDKGVATSGDYERFKIVNEKRYHHLFDPWSGFPAEKVISVTIIAPSAMTADALATAVFISGEKDGLKLIEKTKGVHGMIIAEKDEKIKISMSKGFKKYFKIKTRQKFFKNVIFSRR